ncbi:MAG: PAS domain S-box protein, partial [Rectinemataceae bacterium]
MGGTFAPGCAGQLALSKKPQRSAIPGAVRIYSALSPLHPDLGMHNQELWQTCLRQLDTCGKRQNHEKKQDRTGQDRTGQDRTLLPVNNPAQEDSPMSNSSLKSWQTIIDSFPIAAMLMDAEHTIILGNRIMEALTGLKVSDCKGKKCWTVYHGPDIGRPPAGCPWHQMVESWGSSTSTMTLEVQGTCCAATCSPQFDEAGKLEFIFHTLTEIPGLATTKEALQETKHRSTLREVELRRKAEVIARARSAGPRKVPGKLSSEETAQTQHELGVHQIELEMQNEELRFSASLLDASREKYFSFYDLAPVGYLTLSAGGSILESNLTASAMLGEARNVLLARPFKRYILKEDLGDYYLFHKRLSESSAMLALELRMVKMDGTAFWAELKCAMVTDAQGARTCRVVISDISDRKCDEEALRASESSLRAIFENSLESFMVIDGDLTIQSFNRVANERAKTVFGIELHQGDSIYRTVMQKDRESFDRDFARAMRGETVCVERSFEAVPDMYWFEFHYAPVRSEAGRISGVFFSVHDITERKLAEVKIRTLLAEKELVLREVHHRIKKVPQQNLWVVFSSGRAPSV